MSAEQFQHTAFYTSILILGIGVAGIIFTCVSMVLWFVQSQVLIRVAAERAAQLNNIAVAVGEERRGMISTLQLKVDREVSRSKKLSAMTAVSFRALPWSLLSVVVGLVGISIAYLPLVKSQ